MTVHRSIAPVAMLVLIALCSGVFAETKIAVINIEQVIEEYHKTPQAEKQISR